MSRRRAVGLDAEVRTVGHADDATGVFDRMRQDRLADRMFGAVELQQRFERHQ